MTNPLDIASDVSLATLVTYRSGAAFGTIARYTSSTNAIVIGGETFLSEPSIEVTMNAQQGGAQDTPVQIRMLLRPPLDALTSQRVHSPVRVDIEELDLADSTSRRKLFAGMIQKSTRNVDGNTGVVLLEIAGWRYALDICSNAALANTTCNSTFGDRVCTVDLAAVQETGTLGTIDGNQVTVTGLATTATAGYWRFGYLAFDGLQILISDYGTGETFTLMSTPPAAWLGQTVTATPGCDKRLSTCRDKWNNEARFTGFGLAIPAYNPLLESN